MVRMAALARNLAEGAGCQYGLGACAEDEVVDELRESRIASRDTARGGKPERR